MAELSSLRELEEIRNPLAVSQQEAIAVLSDRGQLPIDYKYGGNYRELTDPFIGERRPILRQKQSMIVGYNSDGSANIETIPAQYGPPEFDSSYSPARRGLSKLNDVFFGDANEHYSGMTSLLRAIPEYFKEQYDAGMGGGTVFNPETQQLQEFDPTSMAIGSAPSGVSAIRAATPGTVTLGAMGGKSNVSPLSGYGDVIQTMNAGEIIRPSMMDVNSSSGYSVAPFMANVDPDVLPPNISAGTFKDRVNQYQNNPIVRNRENARLEGGEIVSPHDTYLQTATYEQLQNKPLIVLPADRLAYGKINKVAGVDVRPFDAQGGPGYSDVNDKWASMNDAAKSKQGHVNRVAEETGETPIMVYTAMGHPGSNFSVGPSIATMRYLEATDALTSKGAVILNDKMKKLANKGDTKGIADAWPGYQNPRQMEEWLTIDNGEGPSVGNRRKAFMDVMDNAELRTEGMPHRNDIYSSVNNPELRNQPIGASGYRALVSTPTNPQKLTIDPTTNLSYDTILDAEAALAMPQKMLPYQIMYRDMVSARAGKTPAETYRSIQTSGGANDYQMADQQFVDEAMAYALGGVRR